MKRLLLQLSAAVLMLCACVFVNAKNLHQDQKEVLDLVKRMYAVSSIQFEASEFEGKFQPEKNCALLSQFLDVSALLKTEQGNCEGQFRYPTADPEDLSRFPKYLPIPEFGVPVVKGDKAEIKVLFTTYDKKPDGGRCLYFLKKTPDGWRIYRVRLDGHAHIAEGEKNPELRNLIIFHWFPE
jgi:hypothetical protein